eukprot:132771_1
MNFHQEYNHFSWEIPFSFLAFQWAGIIYVYHRNTYIDRAAVSLVFTIAIQEVLQTLIWMFGINENTTITQCNLLNQISSHLIMFLFFLFPVIQLKFAHTTSFYNDLFRSDSVRKGSLKLLLILYYFWYSFCIGIRIYNEITYNESLCVFVGDHNQQDWSAIINVNGMTQAHIAWKLLIYTMNALYLLPNVLLFALYRPLWVISCHAVCTLGSFCVLYGIYGTEAVSMWSLISLFNFIWILLSPHIASWMIDRGFISFHNPSKFLYGSHGHFLQHDILKSEFEDDEYAEEQEREQML